MSVFRYGLVGPNFQPNLLSEQAAGNAALGAPSGVFSRTRPYACGKKGKMVNIPLLLNAGDFRWRHRIGSVFWLIVELNILFVYF